MTVLAHVENGTVTGVYDLLPDNWRNISNFSALDFDADNAFLYNLGWRKIEKAFIPTYDPSTQQLSVPTYQYDPSSDVVTEVISIVDINTINLNDPPQVIQASDLEDPTVRDHRIAMIALRNKRDTLLAASDYTQVADVVEKNGADLTAEFVTYRQELRDLPATYENDLTFINENAAVYPVKPGEV